MNIVLHIGMEKTGSTSIQHWLQREREEFRREGWHIPTTLGKTNHRQLSILAFDHDRRDDATKKHGVKSDEDLINLQNKIYQRLAKEIRQAKNLNCHSILASSELVSSRLMKQSERIRLLEQISSCGAEHIRLILFLRDPADLAESRHTTAIVHEGRTSAHPPNPGSDEANRFGNQKALEEGWRKACATIETEAELEVLQYETVIKSHKSSCCGLSLVLNLGKNLYSAGRKTSKNKPLPHANLEALRLINKFQKWYPKLNDHNAVKSIILTIRKLIYSIKPLQNSYKMPIKLRKEYNQFYGSRK